MVAVVIPALDPPDSLASLVRDLTARPQVAHVVVVDDGSAAAAGSVFARVAAMPGVTVLRHDRNLGKGAALKRAFAFLERHDDAAPIVVTADADGQHLCDDIIHVAETALAHPEALVLGVRNVGCHAPLRSRFGNWITGHAYGWLIGQRLADTQTGLRAFPRARLHELSAVGGTGYEYELNVLVHCRQSSIHVVEVPVTTVYLDRSRRSHFRPVRDSWRVYAALSRFTLVSIGTAVADNLVFLAASLMGLGPGTALSIARVVAASMNYPLVKRWVFRESARELPTLAPYLTILLTNAACARLAIAAMQEWGGFAPFAAKVAWESLFFLPNFLLQRDLVFRSAARAKRTATDWSAYYSSVPVTASLTRRYTARRLVAALGRSARLRGPILSVAELGGAASCFVDRIAAALAPAEYIVVDTNAPGLARLRSWRPPAGSATKLRLIGEDVRALTPRAPVDTVFSVGLIEHFDRSGTQEALAAHFALVRPGGTVVVSYPTPTWLYVATRRVLEAFRLWRFPDERPLRFAEVCAAVGTRATVLDRQVLWPLLLTQEMVVFVKR